MPVFHMIVIECVCFAEYPPDVPVFHMRLVPAVLGSLVTPLVYEIAVELRLSRWAAAIAGAFILLGKVKFKNNIAVNLIFCFTCRIKYHLPN